MDYKARIIIDNMGSVRLDIMPETIAGSKQYIYKGFSKYYRYDKDKAVEFAKKYCSEIEFCGEEFFRSGRRPEEKRRSGEAKPQAERGPD